MAARRGAAHSPSAEVPLAVRWALNGEGDAGGIIGMYELRQVLHAAGLSSEGNKEELVERIRNNKEAQASEGGAGTSRGLCIGLRKRANGKGQNEMVVGDHSTQVQALA